MLLGLRNSILITTHRCCQWRPWNFCLQENFIPSDPCDLWFPIPQEIWGWENATLGRRLSICPEKQRCHVCLLPDVNQWYPQILWGSHRYFCWGGKQTVYWDSKREMSRLITIFSRIFPMQLRRATGRKLSTLWQSLSGFGMGITRPSFQESGIPPWFQILL